MKTRKERIIGIINYNGKVSSAQISDIVAKYEKVIDVKGIRKIKQSVCSMLKKMVINEQVQYCYDRNNWKVHIYRIHPKYEKKLKKDLSVLNNEVFS